MQLSYKMFDNSYNWTNTQQHWNILYRNHTTKFCTFGPMCREGTSYFLIHIVIEGGLDRFWYVILYNDSKQTLYGIWLLDGLLA